jgi:enoyl-CoA hydratase/carnithine racemase
MEDLTRLRYEERGDIATITLACPERGNRIDVAFVDELRRVCAYLEDESPCPVVVLRADGPDFCEGIDFSAFEPGKDLDIHGFARWEKAVVALERLPKATVAAVQGRVIGGGAQLALACDQRVAAADVEIRFPEVHFGFLPGMGVFRLAKHIGLGHAKRAILTAERIGASRAEALGLVDVVAEDLDLGVADAIASLGPVHVVAVQLARRLLDESFHDTYEDAIGHFLAAQHRCIRTTDFLAHLERERGG